MSPILITVSPFESATVFESRISHALSQRSGKGQSTEWEIQNVEWKAYKKAKSQGAYIPIYSIGIIDRYVIDAMVIKHAKLKHPRLGLKTGAVPRIWWEMAHGSGGALRQIVQKDSIPDYWNWEAAQFVNVQILNTVAFESVTGLAAPISSISFEEYTKAGISSLSYYPDAETSEAVGVKFSVVRTIGNMDLYIECQACRPLRP